MPKLPAHLRSKPAADSRTHPIQGLLYRVRDRDWAVLWGENLSWEDAKKLCAKVIGSQKSKTARVEAMDMLPPPELEKQVAHSRAEAEAAGRVLPSLKVMKPSAPKHDAHLAAMQAPALAAAGAAAAEAQKRRDQFESAAGRRGRCEKERGGAE